MLNRIETKIGELSDPGAPAGYLKSIPIVRFNAWQYAEANLWASLVNRVLQELQELVPAARRGGLPTSSEDPSEVSESSSPAGKSTAEKVAEQLTKAEEALESAQRKLVWRRTITWAFVALVLVGAGVALVLFLIGGWGQVVAGVTAVVTLFGAATAAVAEATAAKNRAKEIADAGRASVGALGRLAGRPEELAVRSAAANVQTLRLAKDQPLRALLEGLSTVTEYGDQLGLVARTWELFNTINTEVSNNRSKEHSGDQPPLERVVIIIDDLDRCAPENVVKVLEAVHLLFDFEMFVVVLAVDMRWLDQSLKVHYRQLLGESGTASPSDYLEKIIQVPVQLSELDETLVMRMIFGLAKQGLPERAAAEPPERQDTGAQVAAPTDKAQRALMAERQRPTRAPLPARVLEISPAEAAALSSVAALVGTTPRTVKRFVNTFQLIKARSQDPANFADPVEVFAPDPSGANSPDPVGAVSPAEIVAFLLAVLTGRSAAADLLFRELASTSDEQTLQSAVLALKTRPPDDGSGADPSAASTGTQGSLEQAIEDVNGWLTLHPRLGSAKVRDTREWVREVARFSFTRTTLT